MTAQPHSMVHSARDAIDCMSITADPVSFRASMEQILASLGEAAAFEATALVCLDQEGWTVERMFGTQGEDGVALIQALTAHLRKRADPFPVVTVWMNCDGPSIVEAGACEPVGALPLAVASTINPRQRSALMLLGECSAKQRYSRPDAASLLVVTELLSFAIERHAVAIEIESLQHRLDEARRREASGPLASAVAHELNNNMTAIMGYAEMAIETAAQDTPLHDYLEEVLDAGMKSQRILERVLKANLVPSDGTMAFCVEDALIEIFPALRCSLADALRLNVDLTTVELYAVGNPADLQQVLLHLCKIVGGSAREAMRISVELVDQTNSTAPPHGRLESGRYIRISVTSSEPMSDLFSATGEGGFPTGGVFASSYEAVATLLDGALQIGGDPGAETRLDLVLPQADRQSMRKNDRFSIGAGDPGNGELVAVIDSDAISRSVWEERLALFGFEPLGFQSRSALAEWYVRHRSMPDLILAIGELDEWAATPSEIGGSASIGSGWIYIDRSNFAREPPADVPGGVVKRVC